MKKTTSKTTEKPSTSPILVQPEVTTATAMKTQKRVDPKTPKKSKATAAKTATKAKTVSEDISQKPAAKNFVNKSKTKEAKPGSNAQQDQPAVPVTEKVQPQKAPHIRKPPKKTKPDTSKVVVKDQAIESPAQANITPGNIWPSWVENLLVRFGMKK